MLHTPSPIRLRSWLLAPLPQPHARPLWADLDARADWSFNVTDEIRSSRDFGFFHGVAGDAGLQLAPGAGVLDFGCGDGTSVATWRAAGYDAYGCDITLEQPTEHLRLIETPYRVPFDDNTFDLVVSNQVFEHVQNPDVAFAEIRRVLKPGGLSLHVFPARWNPIEVHSRVPFASVIQSYPWLVIWARLGLRNHFQSSKPWREVARLNTDFLRSQTSYPTRRQLRRVAGRYFRRVEFPDLLTLKHGNRTRRLYPVAKALPPLAWAYGGMRARTMLLS